MYADVYIIDIKKVVFKFSLSLYRWCTCTDVYTYTYTYAHTHSCGLVRVLPHTYVSKCVLACPRIRRACVPLFVR